MVDCRNRDEVSSVLGVGVVVRLRPANLNTPGDGLCGVPIGQPFEAPC